MIEFSLLDFVAFSLAVWRVAYLLVEEDGPARIFDRLRALANSLRIDGVFACVYCMSVWVAFGGILLAIVSLDVLRLLSYALSASAVAIGVHETITFAQIRRSRRD